MVLNISKALSSSLSQDTSEALKVKWCFCSFFPFHNWDLHYARLKSHCKKNKGAQR